jgi:hypothetical protein
MRQLIRSVLLKVPAVRRQIGRLNDLELISQQQAARLDSLELAMSQVAEDHRVAQPELSMLAKKFFVVCTPKSGSSFVVTLLQQITGFGHHNPIFGGEPMLEADPYLPNLEMVRDPAVSQLHCYAKPKNLELCRAYSIKPIFHTRDIFDSLLSMKEYIDRVPHHEVFPHYYQLQSEERRRIFIISIYAPIFVRLVAGWHEAYRSQKAPILWSTYETFFRDPVGQTRRMLDHLGLEYSEEKIRKCLESTKEEAVKTKLNKGVTSRGKIEFSSEEQARVYDLIENFPGFDALGAGLVR